MHTEAPRRAFNSSAEEEMVPSRETILQLEKLLAERQLELVSVTGVLLELERIYEEHQMRMRELRPYLNAEGRRLLDLLLNNSNHQQNTSRLTTPEQLYNSANSQFYDKLHQLAPAITRQERIFCSHLRMHFSPAEIADMTQKSRNSVNVAFSRIRGKLGVSSNDELKKLLVGL